MQQQTKSVDKIRHSTTTGGDNKNQIRPGTKTRLSSVGNVLDDSGASDVIQLHGPRIQPTALSSINSARWRKTDAVAQLTISRTT